MRKAAALVLALVVGLPATALSQQARIAGDALALTDFLPECRPQQRQSNLCFLYIAGVLDLHRDMTGLQFMKPVFCLPEEFKYGSAVELFYQWALKNREHFQNDTASIAVINAFRDTFPCPKTDESTKAR